MRIKSRLTIILLIALICLQAFPCFLVTASAADERNTDLDIITSIEITDSSGNPLPANPEKDADVIIYYTFAIPNGATGSAGDFFTMSVPDEFQLDQNLTALISTSGGELLATAVLDASARTITLTFEDNAFYYYDVTGEFWFTVSFDADNIANVNPVDIAFDIGQTVAPYVISINFNQPPPPEATLIKSGNYNSATKEITWTLRANEEGASISDMQISDIISAEHEFVPGSVYLNGSPAPVSEYDYDAGSRVLTYTFSGPVSTQQVVTYQTSVLNSAMLAETGSNLSIANNADLIADGFTIPSNTATVDIPVDFLDKSRSYSASDKEITWTLTVNEYNLTVLNAVISDTLPAGLTLDPATVTDTYNGSTVSLTGSFSITGSDLSINLGNIAETHVIEFVTDVDIENYRTQDNESFTNTATLSGTDVVANNTASSSITPNTRIIEKSGIGYDASTGIISWRIAVNSNSVSMNDVVITDLISENQDYIIGSFAISPDPGGVLTTGTADEIVYTFPANIIDPYIITFDTQVTDPDIFLNNYRQDHYNSADVTLSNGTGGTSTGSQLVTSVVLDKASGSYDYVSRQMTWTIEVNQNHSDLNNVVVTDTIPAGQTFDEASFAVTDSSDNPYDASNANLVYDPNSFTYTFPGPINDHYTITYKTAFTDLTQLEQNQTVTLNNAVTLDHDDLTNPVSDSTTGTFTSEVVSKSQDYTSGNDYIDWEVIINRNHISYDSAYITDVFEQGLELDTSSIALYQAAVDSNNDITIGTPVVITGANISYDLDSRTLIFILPSPITTPYVLTFRTYVTDKSRSPFDNAAILEANGVPPEQNEIEDEVAVSFVGAGGSATGSVGSITVTKVDMNSPSTVLEGAVFELVDQYDIVVNRVTTNSSGEAFFDRIRFDVPYTVREVTPPVGYNPSPSSQDSYSFLIESGASEPNITHTFENEQIIGDIQFTKLDENSDPLQGAEFTLYQGGSATAYTATSDADGLVAFTDIPYGDYVIRESGVPTGYAVSITEPTASITVHGATVTAAPASLSNRLVISDITFTKLDENSNPLSGAVFTLYDSSDAVVATATSGVDGVVLFDDIEYGDYTIVETAAPDGYTRSDTVHNVSVVTDGATITLTSPDFTDPPLNASITFTKLDPESIALPGAEFTLYDDASQVVDTAVSDASGVVTFSDVAPGDYTIEETGTPTGYVTNTTVLTATVADNVSDAIITAAPATITNAYIIGSIVLNKWDDSSRPLQGAEFTLYDDTDTVVATTVSDANGFVVFSGVKYGDYTIRETQAPAGYIASTEVYTASIRNNGESVVATPSDSSNKQIVGAINFTKTDEDSQPLKDAEFTLYAAGDTGFTQPLATAISDASGTVTFDTVIYGDYLIAETDSPVGYVLSSDTLTASIRTDGETVSTTPDTFENILIRADITVHLTNTGGTPLRGGLIALYDSSGTQVSSGTTDRNGDVTFPDVPFGEYTLKQLEAPSGYILSDEVLSVSVSSAVSVYEAGTFVDTQIISESDTVRTGDRILFYAIGLGLALVLLVLIVVLIVARRRKDRNAGGNGY